MGLTPTANKLYQLVRKGSMSAPAEALARFWETLREKSRVRIEHPDLPQQLQGAAGEMVSALWQQAQAAAQDSLVQLRDEARAAVVAAEGLAQSAGARADAAEAALGSAQHELRAAAGADRNCKASWPGPRARSPPSSARSMPQPSSARSCRRH
jgi:hypothetical protein